MIRVKTYLKLIFSVVFALPFCNCHEQARSKPGNFFISLDPKLLNDDKRWIKFMKVNDKDYTQTLQKKCAYCKDNVIYLPPERDSADSHGYVTPRYSFMVRNDADSSGASFYFYKPVNETDRLYLSPITDTLFTIKKVRDCYNGLYYRFCGIYDKYLIIESININRLRVYDLETKKILINELYFNSISTHPKVGVWGADPTILCDGSNLIFWKFIKIKEQNLNSVHIPVVVQKIKINLVTLKRENLEKVTVNIFLARN